MSVHDDSRPTPLEDANSVILAHTAGKVSHALTRTDAGWEYGERTCFDDTCQCISHNPWYYQDVTEAEARQLIEAFTKRGEKIEYHHF